MPDAIEVQSSPARDRVAVPVPERVSVVVPTYNRAGYLRECLESVLGQTQPPFEVVVVDDGSEGDDTRRAVESFGGAVRYLRKENGGKPRALNFAIPQLSGDLVWIFDDDDVALPHSIEVRAAVLRARPELGFVVSAHYVGVDGADGRIRPYRQNGLPVVSEAEMHLALMKGCFVSMQSMLVRTPLLRRAGAFDPQLITSEDYDMMLRLAALAPFTVVREPTYILREHPGVRGPRGSEYAAAKRAERFRHYDGVVGRKLRETTPLEAFAARPGSAIDAPGAQFDALLGRMQVMASKGLPAEMIDDLVAALELRAGAPSIGTERLGACADAVCTGYAFDAIASDWPGFLRLLPRVRRAPAGRRAILQVARGFVRAAKSYPGTWRARFDRLFGAVRIALHAL